MGKIISKSIFGMNLFSYLTFFFFGALIATVFYFVNYMSYKHSLENFHRARDFEYWLLFSFTTMCLFLYPYSRYAYLCFIDFFKTKPADNEIIVTVHDSRDAWYLIIAFFGLIFWYLCFVFSPLLAPFGWLILYIQNNKIEKELQTQE